MAKAAPGVWGIDMGQCALKAIRLEMLDGELTATAFDYIEHPKILSQPDADPDQLTREALGQFLSRNQLRGDEVAIGVPGQAGLARFVKLPPVEPKKIPDIVRFEAKQQIPFPLDEVIWDYQTLGSRGESKQFVEIEIGLFAMKRDMVHRYLQVFRALKVEVHCVQMAPLALCNFVAYDLLNKEPIEEGGKAKPAAGEEAAEAPAEEAEEKKLCVVALDVGVDNTNLVVTDGEKIIWQRPIPIGGNHFTRALTKDFKLTFAKAEHLKRNATKAEDPRKVFQAMKPVFSDFAGEVQRSLGFFTNTHRDAHVHRLIGLGNAFRLPGLQKFLSQALGVELEKLPAFERLKGEEVLKSPVYTDNVLSFGVAYGLALQALHLSRLKTNLLPQEIVKERAARSRKPWAVAAAACLFIGTTILAWSVSSEYDVAKAASAAATAAKKVPEEQARLDGAYKAQQDKIRKAYETAMGILRGDEARTNWHLIHQYVNECVPRPDGSNLPYEKLADGQWGGIWKKYWTEKAREAWTAKKNQDEKGLKEESHRGDLIQMDIVSVMGRYCEVAMATSFFTKVKPDIMVRAEFIDRMQWDKPPDKPGWLIEIRGVTYHDKLRHFVIDTIGQNLLNGPYGSQPAFRNKIRVPLHDPSGKWLKLNISHVALYKVDEHEWSLGNDPGFKFINQPLYLDDLVSGGGQAAAGPGEGAGDRKPGGTGIPAGGSAQAAKWGDGLGTGFSGIFGSSTSRAGTTTDKSVHASGKKITRTEFVIVFYWVEPGAESGSVSTGKGTKPPPGEETAGTPAGEQGGPEEPEPGPPSGAGN